MRSNNQKENQALTPMQKQAVLVCIVCALAALLTIGITLTMLKRGKNPTEQPGDSSIITPAPAPEGEEDISDHYQINETSSALLTRPPMQAMPIRSRPFLSAIPTRCVCMPMA